jgi:SAM-dependent methyltransferase
LRIHPLAPGGQRSELEGSYEEEIEMTVNKRLGDADEIREKVQEGYTRVAQRDTGCCGAVSSEAGQSAQRAGYSEEELQVVPEGANLGVGCGNPTALASLRPGEVVLDLGSGAGFDAFLVARAVGPTGRVIGVDMTDAMLEKARENARKGGFANVEFRKGAIEDLPLEGESVDVIISNCVINLSPEKDRVFREAYRVLRPGGRLLISDIVLERPLPPEVTSSLDAYLGCVGGASLRKEYLETIQKAGFREVEVVRESNFGEILGVDNPEVREGAEQLGIGVERQRNERLRARPEVSC